MKMKKGFRQMVDEAKSRIKTIGLAEAKRCHGRDDVVFVELRDVREPERDGIIPGAFHCRRGMLAFWIDPESPYHKDVFASGKEFVFGPRRGADRMKDCWGGGLPRRRQKRRRLTGGSSYISLFSGNVGRGKKGAARWTAPSGPGIDCPRRALAPA